MGRFGERNCPKSLPVNRMVQSGSMYGAERMLCATCVGGCPKGAIRYAWARPRTR